MTRDVSQQESRAFWESRGQSNAVSSLQVTMLAEHTRYLEYVHRMEIDYLERQLRDYDRPRILDLGCGIGRLSFWLAPRAREVVGADIAASMIELATRNAAEQKIGNVRFIVRALGEPLDDLGEFDLAIVSGVLNNVDEEAGRRTINALAEHLRPGGRLYLRNNCSTGKPFYKESGPQQPPTMHRSPEQYVEWVTAVPGMTVLEERYLFDPLCLPNFVYYHVLPIRYRQTRIVSWILDRWFEIEARTSEVRVRMLGRVYPRFLQLLGKPTAMRVLVARREACSFSSDGMFSRP